MKARTESAIQIEEMIEEALAHFHLDPDLFAIDYMITDYRNRNLDLDSIDALLGYTTKRIVYDSIANGQLRQAKEQCTEFGLDFHEMRLTNRDMHKVEA